MKKSKSNPEEKDFEKNKKEDDKKEQAPEE